MKYLRSIILVISFFLIFVFAEVKTINAVACVPAVNGALHTVNGSCSFSGSANGVDSGSGTTNTAVLKPALGTTITVSAGQTLGTGSIDLIGGGSIVIMGIGSQIKLNTPIWMADMDADGYAASTSYLVQTTTPTNHRRRYLLKTPLFLDRNDGDALRYNSVPLLDSADTYTNWTSSNSTSGALLPNTSDKLEGTGALLASMSINTGNGVDGALSVTSGTTTINTTLSGTLAGTATATTATVASTTGFAANNEVFLIQIMGTGAGNYEYRTISAVNSGTQVTFSAALTNTYTNDSNSKAQMIKVPQYTTVSVFSGAVLTVGAWNGTTGGVLVFRATGTVTVNGTIDGNGKGFTGGGNIDTVGAYQGKSYPSPNTSITRNANSGGGGGGSSDTVSGYNGGGGAGGGYGAVGSNGGNAVGGPTPGQGGFGGGTYGTTALTTLFFGSGGGGGANYMNGPAGDGGTGGGIIVINTNTLTVNTGAVVRSNGSDGGCKNNTAGAGGGGSGGSVLINVYTATLGTNLVTASGGIGSTTLCSGVGGGGNGGNGGVGRIRCDNSAGNCTGTSPAPYSAALPNPQNVTITKTIIANDMSQYGRLSFWVKSNLTGAILRLGMGEAAATEQTFNATVNTADTWEEKVWDISAIPGTSRDAIQYLGFTYLSTSPSSLKIDAIVKFE